MVNWLEQRGMKTKVVGQIHDSMLLDVHPGEMKIILRRIQEIMTEEIRDHWTWIITRLAIEAEASPTNWFQKEKVSAKFD